MTTEDLHRKGIDHLVEIYDYPFPSEFLNFLGRSCPCVIEYAEPPLRFRLWDVEELIQWRRELQMSEFLPNFLAFGGDGANEMLTFKLDEPNEWAVFMTPMIVMSEDDSQFLAPTFTEFLEKSIYVGHRQPPTHG